MYNNPGKKIKNIASVLQLLLFFIICVIGVGALYLIRLLTPVSLTLTVVAAALLSYPAYLMLYAFGELVEDVHAIRVSSDSTTDSSKTDS